MADIVKTAAQIAPVYPNDAVMFDGIAGAALTAGDAVYWNSAGKLVKSNAGAGGTAKFAGIALKTVGIGQAVTVLKEGHVAGFTVSGMAYAAKAYLSDTAGALGDAAGTTSVVAGVVVPLPDASLTKVLFVSAEWPTTL